MLCQGDCLSALLFIFYLAHIITDIPLGTIKEDHHEGEICWSELYWLIDRDENKVAIDPKYDDDVTFIRSSKSEIQKLKYL